jgi:flavin reductase (DIM6/NTAB) family NADH-FMN oxidoreductase RutF
MIGMVVPRPIAWVSTVSEDGTNNLAPYSFFNAISGDPPVVCFAPSRKPAGDNKKDTLRNLEATGVFVVNIVSEHLAEAMNQSAADVPPEVDEFALAGVSVEPATMIQAPMVKEALAKMECRVRQIIPLGDRPTSGILVLGDVLCFHFAEGLVDNFKVDPAMLNAVGRMGGTSYCDTRHRFDLTRPGGNTKL